MELEISEEQLRIIEINNRNSCEDQCRVMLSRWLSERADGATWKKLLSVLDRSRNS